MLPTIIATFAIIINSVQLFPQLYKTYTTKKVQDLSIYSLTLMLITKLLWLIHGYFIDDITLIISGIISLLTIIPLLILYFSYHKK